MLDPALLLSRQNPDGGWGYGSGAYSATEPTSYALLALTARAGVTAEVVQRGVAWLKSNQRHDGGWAPRPPIQQSTWVTALPLLLDPQLRESFDVARATDFLTAQSGRESGFVYRARLFLLGEKVLPGGENPGWPWYPETAAWVSPTALTILALEKAQRERPSETLAQRCESGRLYLKAHRCADGGWNHGSSQALGYDAGSYPETTGLALLALHGEEGLLPSLSLADRYLPGVRSMEAASWLRLGLLAHRRPIPEDATGRLHPRTTVDLALGLLAEAASHGKNAFLD